MGEKMNCKKYRHALSLQLDQELNEHDGRKLQTHLDSCSLCRLEKIKLERLFAELQSSFLEEPSPLILPGILSKISKKKSTPARNWFGWFWLKPVFSGFSALLLLALAIWLGLCWGDYWENRKSPQSVALSKDLLQNVQLLSLSDIPRDSFGEVYQSVLSGESR